MGWGDLSSPRAFGRVFMSSLLRVLWSLFLLAHWQLRATRLSRGCSGCPSAPVPPSLGRPNSCTRSTRSPESAQRGWSHCRQDTALRVFHLVVRGFQLAQVVSAFIRPSRNKGPWATGRAHRALSCLCGSVGVARPLEIACAPLARPRSFCESCRHPVALGPGTRIPAPF